MYSIKLLSLIFPTEETGHGLPHLVPTLPRDSVLRIMTLNIWQGGSNVDDGIAKIAKHISINNPDIVALQEVTTKSILPSLQALLGQNWTYRYRDPSSTGDVDIIPFPDVGILTQHAIIDDVSPIDKKSVKAKIRISYIDGSFKDVNFWSIRLSWHSYGPYAACNRMVTSPKQIYAGEINLQSPILGRIQDITNILNLDGFRQDLISDQLIVIAGDFNSPSHLDWIEATRKNHCEWVYAWPATKILSDSEFKDAFREAHPDPMSVPGNTWSPTHKFYDGDSSGNWGWSVPEIMDRIDMIHFKSNRWKVIGAYVYSGDQLIRPIPDHGDNDWPSDHASVIAEFKYM